MSRSAARKYAKVLAANGDKSKVEATKEYLLAVSSLFKEPKFRDTILSPLVSTEEKVALLVEGEKNAVLSNLIKLLVEKDRLELVPYIYEELRLLDAMEANTFQGYVYASVDVDDATMDELKTNISKSIDASIDFERVKSDEDGFRVEVPDLGLEVSFSEARLKSQLIDHILRGI